MHLKLVFGAPDKVDVQVTIRQKKAVLDVPGSFDVHAVHGVPGALDFLDTLDFLDIPDILGVLDEPDAVSYTHLTLPTICSV